MMIVTILGIAAAVGPVLVVIGQLLGAISGIIGFFKLLIPVVTAVSGVMGGAGLLKVLGAVVAFLTGPIGLAIGALIALVGLLYLAWVNNWGGIQEATAVAVQALGQFFGGIVVWLVEAIPKAITTLFGWFDRLKAYIAGITLPSWMQGFLGTNTTVTGTAPPTTGVSNAAFQGAPGGGGGGTGRATVNQVNAPLVGQVNVNSQQDADYLVEQMRDMMERDFGIATGQNVRYPVGYGTEVPGSAR
jgi:hypothetical protein